MTNKPFKDQTIEERYRILLHRLNNLLTNWTMRRDSMMTKAVYAEGDGSHPGAPKGLRAKAHAISYCHDQLRACLSMHNRAAEREKVTVPESTMIEPGDLHEVTTLN